MGLFDKKYCDICGEKIKFLGNNKLEDGNMCNACEKKLSVWFSSRRHSTVAEIKEQLAYREENAKLFSTFCATRELGTSNDKFILIDDNLGRFVILREGENMQNNPDLLELSKVQAVRLEVKEDRSEVKRKNPDGSSVSFNPPHYKYKYKFYIIINYSGQFFNEIKFQINTMSINGGADSDQYVGETYRGNSILGQLGFNTNTVKVDNFGRRMNLPGGYRADGFTTMLPKDIQLYQEYELLGNQIVSELMKNRDAKPENYREILETALKSGDPNLIAAANAKIINSVTNDINNGVSPQSASVQKTTWECEYCGKKDNTSKFCVDCGAPKL